ncbi:winged helix-turn-helix domain-containing protein [Paenibacillus campi]|uniref:ArsR/SmtB family transcription factor n=1 Tax=Paenibacillus campi TaxID=3106031 RepID=UPI002AFDDBEF|nr:winged helix-turn-helix domain-containing protein [Paenibacillus sp. SGZ-1014]
MKMLYHPDRNDIELTSVLYALSDPIRLHIILQIMSEGESPCNAFQVPIAKSTLSHHLRTLRESGVVFTRSQGTQRLITVREDDLNDRFPGVLEAVLRAYAANTASITIAAANDPSVSPLMADTATPAITARKE